MAKTNNAAPKRNYAAGCLYAAAIVWLLPFGFTMLMAFAARFYWVFDLTTHFHFTFGVAALPSLIVFLCLRTWRTAIVASIVVAVHLGYVAPIYWPVVSPSKGNSLKVLYANVLTENHNFDALLRLIKKEDPDFIALVEVNDGWLAALRSIEDKYHFRVFHPRNDNFGMAIYSKSPIASSSEPLLGGAGLPAVLVEAEAGERSFLLTAAHPLPPINSRNAKERNWYLEELADELNESKLPKVVVGDLNATTHSPYIGDFLSTTNLRDGRQGLGIQPSWPDLPWLFRIPIDHTFVSENVTVHDRRVGASIGSDHRPVILSFSIE